MAELQEKNKRIVLRFGEAHATHRLDLLDDLVTVDFVRHCQATPWVQIRNREEFKRFLEQDRQGAPDAKITPIHLLAEGDCVAMFGVFSGTQTGDWGPLPPSGKQFHTDCGAVFRLAGGKIAELWITWDNVTLLMQLGHWPPPDPGAGPCVTLRAE